MLKKSGLNIDLVNEHEEDIKLAKLLMYKKGNNLDNIKYREKSIFKKNITKIYYTIFRYKKKCAQSFETINYYYTI